MRAPSPWVIRHAGRIRQGGTVLDVAAGSGRHARYVHALGHRVVAVDIDVSNLEDVRDVPGIELVEADLEHRRWPLEGRRFDAIVVTNYLHRPLFPVLAQSLAPDGVLIYETFARGHERFGSPTNPDFLLRDGELMQVLGRLLHVVEYEQTLEEQPRPALKQRICALRLSV